MSTDTEQHEIEITPEMIEAGVRTFLNYDSKFEEPADCVVDIFTAMAMAHLSAA